MRDLKDIRIDINEVDKKILELFEKRMDLALEVAEYKIENNMPVFDASREKEKLETVKRDVKNQKYQAWAVELVCDMMRYSKEYQKKIIEKCNERAEDIKWIG